MPFLWGSTFWDLAVTDRRILAVQRTFLPAIARGRRVVSVRPEELQELDVSSVLSGTQVRLLALRGRFKFKLAAFPRDVRDTREALLEFRRRLSGVGQGESGSEP